MERIYLDHAATTPLDNEILQKMLPYLTDCFGNADSPHAHGRKAMGAVDNARDTLAELLGAKPSEVYFTSGGTESDNWALVGGAYAMKEQGRDHVIVSAIEHHAVLAAAEKLQKEGFAVSYLPVNGQGRVETKALEELISARTGIVAVMTVNNETGAVQPIRALAEIAHKAGALFFTDAVQAAPHMPLRVQELGVDMLSVSSHKFYGPKGCGALYIKSGVKVKPLIVGGEQERGLRGGTTNVAATVGMAAAYRKTVATVSQTSQKMQTLRKAFLDGLAGLDGLHIYGDEGVSAVLSMRIEGVTGVDLVYKLDLNGVSISAGAACASASVKPSHVLMAMGLTEIEARECVRVSFGKDNTEADVKKAAALIKEIAETLRKN
ncbi:MAG: cysteine desulfurase [Clostridiales bacterium]|nr:cysteine desulfurase [Clostridiales bacterium]